MSSSATASFGWLQLWGPQWGCGDQPRAPTASFLPSLRHGMVETKALEANQQQQK